MKKAKFAPSLICMDMLRAGEQAEVMNRRADYFHVDLMDLKFVANAGLSLAFTKAVASAAKKPVDCHMMCLDLGWWMPRLKEAGADMLTPHIEVTGKETPEVIAQIRALGCKAGLAVSPETPAPVLGPYLPLIDKVTVMTIRPGFPGARFLPEMAEKIAEIAKMRGQAGLDFEIEMDGSLADDNFAMLRAAGCDVFVAGTAALFGRDPDLDTAFDKMEKSFGLS